VGPPPAAAPFATLLGQADTASARDKGEVALPRRSLVSRDGADIGQVPSGERRGEAQQAAHSHEVLPGALLLIIFALNGGAAYAIP
jgi:hypothetical protein